MTFRFAIVFVAALTLQGCVSETAVDPRTLNLETPTGYLDFIPQAPQRSPRITYFDSTGAEVTKSWTQLNNSQIMNILSNTRGEISVGKFDAQGNLTYVVAKATGKVGTYRVIMDYSNYVTEDVIDATSSASPKPIIGQGRVGVGLRLTADITTTTADVNLGSLLALGIAANAGQVKGTMTVESIGIRIPGSAGPILSNTTIDETSIQKTLESIAVIQSKIADKGTVLDPQVLAVKPLKPAIKPDDVTKKLM
jgi:hypothetical protein